MKRIGLALITLAMLAAIVAAHYQWAQYVRGPALPLVGYGCQGAGGPLYAKEESDFPIGERIKTNY